MNKSEFIEALRAKLSALPKEDAQERLHFYREMIEDRMEEGLSEGEAVSAVGNLDEISAEIVAEFSRDKAEEMIPEEIKTENTKEKKARRHMRAGEIVLLVLGAPLWIPILIAVFAIILSLYTSLWAVIISLWAVVGAVVLTSIGGIMAGIGFALGGFTVTSVATFGASLIVAGVSVLLFVISIAATKGAWFLTKIIFVRRKKSSQRKEKHNG